MQNVEVGFKRSGGIGLLFVCYFLGSGTFKERVGSVWDAAAVGPVGQAPLCKLEEGNDISEFIKQSLQDTAQLGWLVAVLFDFYCSKTVEVGQNYSHG